MRLFPSVTEYFRSPYTPAELLRRLQNEVGPARTWRDLFRSADKRFRGTISVDRFDIQRSIGFRDSMLPHIRGRVETDAASGGSLLMLRHRLAPGIFALAIFWFSALIWNLVGALSNSVSCNTINGEVWGLLGIMALEFIVITVPFWLEFHVSRSLLMKIMVLGKKNEG